MATATVLFVFAIVTTITIGDIKCIPKQWPIPNECKKDQVGYDCNEKNEGLNPKLKCMQVSACCKWDDPDEAHWDLVKAYQNTALQAMEQRNMQYTDTNNRAEWQKETWIKHDKDYKMFVLPLTESKIATVAAARYQMGGQLNKWKSSSKKEQVKANMDKSATECNAERPNYLKTSDGVTRCDARVKVTHESYKDRPYSRVGVVHSRHQTGNDYSYEPCSGTVVGHKWVLTAAHCITDKSGYINPVKMIRFYAQLNTEKAATYDPNVSPPRLDTDSGTYKVSAVYLPYGFITGRHPARTNQEIDQEGITNYDIALLELATRVNTGYLGFSAQSTNTIQGWINDNNDKLITIGYPGDRKGKANNAGYRHGGTNPMYRPFKMHKSLVLGKGRTKPNDNNSPFFTQISPKKIKDQKYKLYGGQSGSSIFHWYPATNTNKGYLSIAVASSVFSGTSLNKFEFSRWCRITPLKGAIMNYIINGGSLTGTNIVSGATRYTATSPPQKIDYGGAYARMEYDNVLNQNLVNSLYEIQKELETDKKIIERLKNRQRRHHKYHKHKQFDDEFTSEDEQNWFK